MVWQVEVESQSNSLSNIAEMIRGAMPSVEQTRAEATDMYTAMASASDLSVLPLVLAAYPSEASNSLSIITPSAVDGVTTKLTSTLDVTLPGSDLLVELFADIAWELDATALATSSGPSSAASTAASSAISSQGQSADHTHQITISSTSHAHNVSTTTAQASGLTLQVATERHHHKMLSHYGGGGDGFGDGGRAYKDGNGAGNWLVAGSTSYAGDLHTFEVTAGYLSTGTASADNHTHNLGTQTAGTIVSSTAFASDVVSAGHTHNIEHIHGIAHTHSVGSSTALLDVKAELVIDDTVITASSSQFHIDGLAGQKGNVPLRSIYVLQKSTAKADALSAGQHTIGLKFTVTTVAFNIATSTVDANNIAFIIRDAAFDDRVKIFTP